MNHENGKEKASFSIAGKNCADITRLDDTLVFIDIFTKNKSSTWISYIPFQQRQILIKNNTSFQVSKGNPLFAVSG